MTKLHRVIASSRRRIPSPGHVEGAVAYLPPQAELSDQRREGGRGRGNTARLCGDMGILVVRGRDGRSYPYILVGIIEKDSRARNYTTWIRSRGDVIRSVSNIVYRGISERHGLRRS